MVSILPAGRMHLILYGIRTGTVKESEIWRSTSRLKGGEKPGIIHVKNYIVGRYVYCALRRHHDKATEYSTEYP